jgi:hypothetical protein
VVALTTVLVFAALQLVLFLPVVSVGRSTDLGPFRADGVALVFGVTWALVIAASSFRLGGSQHTVALLLLLVGLSGVAYAREPLLLYAGWEVATAGLWLARPRKGTFDRTAAAMHLAGIPLLAAILLGLVTPFAPPPGGAAEPWHPAILVVFAVVVLLRIWLALLATPTPTDHRPPTTCPWLYATAAPILLVKALVAAPVDPFGIWLLALVGTSTMLLGLWSRLAPDRPTLIQALGWVWAGCAIAALGLATGSPLAAAGAVWLMLTGAGMGAVMGGLRIEGGTRRTAGIVIAGVLPGIWLIAQGALDLRYGIVIALLLPCLLGAVLGQSTSDTVGYRLPSFVVAAALSIAVYPQLPIELAVRPVVQAMAGGVGALSTLEGDWGVGLMVRPTQVGLSAGLPATGMLVAVFLAFATLYWLRRLVGAISHRSGGSKGE